MALFPKQYLDALVSIEVKTKNGEMLSIASAFLFGLKIPLKDQQGNQRYLAHLITNRHVVEEANGDLRKSVFLRFNVQGTAKYYPVDLLNSDGKPLWLKHENKSVDIAVLPFNGSILGKDKIDYFLFTDDNFIFLSSEFDKVGIAPGDGVFVLGFPMGIRGQSKNRVIVRQGIISRVDEELLKNYYFYIDASAYPGNSGGPVISRPEIVAITGTKSVNQSRLIGVVSSGEPYQDIAISQQTGRPRIIFEEQTGLVRIVPIDAILEILKPIREQVVHSLEKDKPAPTNTESIERIEGVETKTKQNP